MKSIQTIVFILAFTSKSVYAQWESSEILLQKARTEVTILCSNNFAGRGYIQDGHHKAADYIARRYQEIGLHTTGSFPDAKGQVKPYQQPFPLKINVVEQSKLYVDGRFLVAGIDYIMHPTTGSGDGYALIKDAGYMLDSVPTIGGGRAVVITDGLPPAIAQDAGMKEKYKDQSNINGRVAKIQPQNPTAILVRKKKLTASFDEEAIDVPYFEVMEDKLPMGVKQVRWQVLAGIKEFQSQNVIGYLEGTVKDTFVIVSAHYDHLGKLNNAIFTGANDNASGVAMLLSMAEYFMQHTPKYSMLFVAFGGEETGLNGSKFYVMEQPIAPLGQTKFVLNLDLMGAGNEGIMAVGGNDFPAIFRKLTQINEDIKAVPIVKSRPNAPNSDHYFFLANGVKGFFVYTMGGPPYYHDVYDTPAHLELSKFVEVRNLLLQFLERI